MKLSINNLSKTYSNGVQALKDISLTVDKGMFGLLGPNGAGKSTLMRTLATLQEADSGSMFLGNIDISTQKNELRKVLGYLPQEFGVYPKVSAQKLLDHLAMLKGITSRKERGILVDQLLERVNLTAHKKMAVHGFSGGMKQRFGIAQTLLANPQLIIVDEPTAGLDPAERNRFYNLLSEIGEQVIVILSTHIVQDVRQLCSQMAIINEGSLIYHGDPDEAISELNGLVWEKLVDKSQMKIYEQDHNVISTKLVSGKPLIHIISPQQPAEGFKLIEAELEDVYFTKVKGVENLVPILE